MTPLSTRRRPDHRRRGARRQLAAARRAAPRRATARRWSRRTATASGSRSVAPPLYAAGCRAFFVAQIGEGKALRALLPEADARIYVLNGLEAKADPLADYAAFRLAPAIGGAAELERWAAFARAQATPPAAALHLDTGMNRLGFESLDALRAAVAAAGASGADLLMSHFVSSERPDDPLNALQIARFEAARAAFPPLRASLANSSGLFLPGLPAYDLGRPGYALYGGNPTPGRPNPMKPVVALDVAIQQTRWIEKGESCGYNAQWTARRRTRLATLLAGYADGLPRARRVRRRPRRGRGRDRRPPLPAGRPRVDGPDHRRRHRSARERGAAGRICAAVRRRGQPRRIRRARRARSATRC